MNAEPQVVDSACDKNRRRYPLITKIGRVSARRVTGRGVVLAIPAYSGRGTGKPEVIPIWREQTKSLIDTVLVGLFVGNANISARNY